MDSTYKTIQEDIYNASKIIIEAYGQFEEKLKEFASLIKDLFEEVRNIFEDLAVREESTSPKQYGLSLIKINRKDNKIVKKNTFRKIQRNLPYQRRVYR